jgi:hypothetical protein
MTGRCMVACAVLALLSAFAGENAHADGKMYVREKVPADIPYQRAVIAHDGTHELLILQSKFTGDAKEFAWVVPIPSNPKLGCIAESREAEALFRRVSSVSPEVIRMGPLVLPAVGLIIILTGIIVYVRDTRKRRMEKLPSPMVSRGFVLILVGLFFALFAVAIPSLTMARSAGVEVLQSAQVGVYDAKVVQAAGTAPLLQWLREEGFQFSKDDEAAFERYVKAGWCFVTAKVTPGKDREFGGREGLVNALMLYFKTKDPVYPLALTGTIGTQTEVVLYVFAKGKQDAPAGFECEYAGDVGAVLTDQLGVLSEHAKSDGIIEPKDFFTGIDMNCGYMCKFRGKLSAAQMKDDLIFKKAPDNEPYRKRIIKW